MASQVFGDQLELFDLGALVSRKRAGDVFQTMVDVVVDQGFLGLRYGLFDRLQLLGQFKAGSARLQHLYDRPQMALHPLEPVDDIGVRGVMGVIGHGA